MVSKTLASLDAWLVLAEEVLGEQNLQQENEPGLQETDGLVQLSFFPEDLNHSR
jgi:hypothetical protein